MPVVIRRATVDDATAISSIWEAVCAERIHTAVNRAFSPQQEREYIASLSDREGLFVAEKDGEVVGLQSLDRWAKYTDSFDHVGVAGTFLLPESRGRGIGRRLAAHTFDFARAKGYEKIVVYVRAGNAAARAFYARLGFNAKGTLERQVKIDGHHEDEILMELFL
jgi:L-amino acid N-acyltransferase YncA